MPRIYQLARCFRNVEEHGPFQHHEFTMLEWYAVDEDYLEALQWLEQLLPPCAPSWQQTARPPTGAPRSGMVGAES